MLARVALVAFALSQLARAEPVPSEPGPGSVYNQGAPCPIQWTPDSTGLWKNMVIDLMTGDNFNMIKLTTVTTIDGTDPSKSKFQWNCPQVTPNSAIYFYQFSQPGQTNLTWTTRFAIADTTGKTTPPQNANQPTTNDPIPWGKGALVGAGGAVSSGSLAGSASGSSAAASSSLPGSILPLPSPSAASSPAVTPTASLPTTSSSGIKTSSAGPSSTGSGAAGAQTSAANSAVTRSVSGITGLFALSLLFW